MLSTFLTILKVQGVFQILPSEFWLENCTTKTKFKDFLNRKIILAVVANLQF